VFKLAQRHEGIWRVELDRGDWSASYPDQSIPLEFSQGNIKKIVCQNILILHLQGNYNITQ